MKINVYDYVTANNYYNEDHYWISIRDIGKEDYFTPGENTLVLVFDDTDPVREPRRIMRLMRQRYPRKPVLISEFGVGTDSRDPKEAARQKQIFLDMLEGTHDATNLAGYAWWCMFRYRGRFSEHGWGLVSLDRLDRSPNFDLIRSSYDLLKKEFYTSAE